jgi:hypothetical protein
VGRKNGNNLEQQQHLAAGRYCPLQDITDNILQCDLCRGNQNSAVCASTLNVCLDEFWLSLRWSHGTVESIASCCGLYSEQLLLVCARHYEKFINPLNAELNPICHLLALLAHHILHVSRIRVNILVTTRRVTTLFMYIQVLCTDMKVVLRKCTFIELNCCGAFFILFSVPFSGVKYE